ncbi:MAG: dihydropteroate synthase [Bacteroidales bacterium]|nr:dihydropteroate synthase [Bacteroidales bacterium]
MLQQLNFPTRTLSLEKPLVMGILNITKDSFYDGGRYLSEEGILSRVEQILAEDADLIDVGAMSTRSNAIEIPEAEERDTIRCGVQLIREHFPQALISIDTWRASVAAEAIAAGADMINDISGGTFDPDLIPLVGEKQVPYCLMHTPAKPDIMQQCTHYEDILHEILHFLEQQLEKLQAEKVHDIMIDPGFGFGKTLGQNYFLMQHLEAFQVFGLPLLVGVSRKSMIYKLLDVSPQDALNGTTVLNSYALLHGAKILRVHDVKAAVEARTICEALMPKTL